MSPSWFFQSSFSDGWPWIQGYLDFPFKFVSLQFWQRFQRGVWVWVYGLTLFSFGSHESLSLFEQSVRIVGLMLYVLPVMSSTNLFNVQHHASLFENGCFFMLLGVEINFYKVSKKRDKIWLLMYYNFMLSVWSTKNHDKFKCNYDDKEYSAGQP